MCNRNTNIKNNKIISIIIISIITVSLGIIFMFSVNNYYTAATMPSVDESNPYEVPGFEEDEALEETPDSNNTNKNSVSEFKLNTSIKSALSNTTEESATQETNYMLGDVDLNGEVNIVDSTQVQKIIAYIIEPTSESIVLADVNADNSVNILDATLIQMYCAGLIDGFVSSEPTTEPTKPTEDSTSNTTPGTSDEDLADLPPKAPSQDGEWGASVKN